MSIRAEEIEGFLSAHERMPTGASFHDGEMFGDWRVTAFLGKGGGGEVYRAVHATLGMVAALKVYVPRADGDVAREEAARMRFVRETAFLAKNAHPAFPRFLGSGERDGRPWYAMELLESRELPSRDGDVAKFLLCVADGVRHLHSLGLVHRDIKPGNILWRLVGPPRRGGRFAESRVPVLADLGLIKDVTTSDARQPTSGVTIGGVGTPRYAAPEQLNGDEITPAVDVYALGMLANECFGGKPPKPWVRIIRRATAAIPAQRYSSVDVFAKAVRFRHFAKRVTGALAVSALLAALVTLVTLWPTRVETTQSEEVEYKDAVCEDLEGKEAECRLDGDDVVTNRIERMLVPRNISSNKTTVASMPQMSLVAVTNVVSARIVRLGGKTNVFTRPLVLDANREYWVEGPGVLDAAVAGPTGAVMYLRKCVFLNRTKESLSINGVRYFLGGHVYLNFTELDEPGFADWQRESQFLVRTGGNVANEIRYKGPETIQELNKLLRQENWNRMYPNRVPEREPGRRGGGSRRRNVPDREHFWLPSS